ncbi:MAG: hypothetical protein H0X39_12500 [Actinobacteria bacterium]|nr:hypothetical protein [Actinomycetota bacterium]
MRYAKDGLLVVSRIDLGRGREVVVGFNNTAAPAHVTIAPATAGATWSIVFGPGTASGGLRLDIPAVSAIVAAPNVALPKRAPGKPTLTGGPDPLTSLRLLSAKVPGGPVSVSFAVRRAGGTWRRVAIDDSAPYRAFLEPSRYHRHERVEAVAVARSTDGSVAVSPVVRVDANP